MASMFLPDPPPQAAAPEVKPPPTMPDLQSPGAMAAKRRTQEEIMGRAGRSSTILSTATSRARAGGDAYNATKLGTGV